MNIELLDGFLLGNYEVEPALGVVERPDGSLSVSPEVMEMLVYLAARPKIVVPRSVLQAEILGAADDPEGLLEQRINDLRAALNDNHTKPSYVQVSSEGIRLIAKVRPLYSDKAKFRRAGFFKELRRREVIRVSIAYWALAWAVFQSVDFVIGLVPEIPVWALKFIMILAIIGFPIAIAYAWVYRWTPSGLIVDKPDGPEPALASQRRVNYLIVGAAVIATTLFIVGAPPSPTTSREIEPTISPVANSIAVLRFLNISDNPAIDYLCDGLTEELIHELTNLKTLKVAARTTVWPYVDTDLQAHEIADEIGVEKVLEGSIRSDGYQIRVTAQLIDGSGFHVWSETYDREMQDILEIQKDIASKVVDELDVILNVESEARLASIPTESNNAYDLYLQGRQALREPDDPGSLFSAQSFFKQAIEVDYQFSLAHAGLCESHLANYRASGDTAHFEKAEIACHRALTLDGGLAEIYTALGNLYRLSGQPEKAEQEYLVALSINPNLEEANYGLGRTYQAQDRMEDAEETLKRSIQMEPGYWGTHFGYANFLHRQGRFEETVPYYERVTLMVPEYAGGFINLGSALHWLGDWDGAEDAFRRALELEPDPMAFQNLGTVFYYQHHFLEAVQMFETAVDVAPFEHRAWGWLASALRFVPEREIAAQVAYQKAIELVNEQLSVNPNEPEDLARLGAYLANSGNLDDAREALNRSMQLAPGDATTHYYTAVLEMNSGIDDKALEKLAKAVQLGYSLEMLEADPTFSALQDRSAAFRALLGNN